MLTHTVFHPGGDGPQPTLLALHGRGANALDLLGLAPSLARGRLLMLCPQAGFELDPGSGAYAWFHRPPDGSLPLDEIDRSLDAVRRFIDVAIERYSVDPARVALLGFSQGGMIGYRLAMSEPERFVGFAALSTALSYEGEAVVASSDAFRRLPVLIQHGRADPLIDVERALESREQLQKLGVEPEYHEYAMAHEIGNESGRDLSLWLERVLGLPSP